MLPSSDKGETQLLSTIVSWLVLIQTIRALHFLVPKINLLWTHSELFLNRIITKYIIPALNG